MSDKNIQYAIGFVLWSAFCFLIGAGDGQKQGHADAHAYYRPLQYCGTLSGNTYAGQLEQCPPRFISGNDPVTFTRIDTGEIPYLGEVLFLVDGLDTIGFVEPEDVETKTEQ